MTIECTLCSSKDKIGSGYEFKFNEARNAIFHGRPLCPWKMEGIIVTRNGPGVSLSEAKGTSFPKAALFRWKIYATLFLYLLVGSPVPFHKQVQAQEGPLNGEGPFPLLARDMAPKLSQVQNFVYLLQAHQVSVSDLSNNGFDLVVMDYAKCGDVCSEYTLNEIAQINGVQLLYEGTVMSGSR